LESDGRLRAAVLGSGAVFAATGIVLILTLPIDAAWATGCVVAWLLLTGTELLLMHRAYARAGRYRLGVDGSIVVYRRDGGRENGRFAAGSVVLANWAWLRIVCRDGSSWGELLRGSARESEQWRRFQVICRHLAAC
jgi:hypothetical protein